MTNEDILNMYRFGLQTSLIAALRTVWNAGWYEGKGVVPTVNSTDMAGSVAKPVAYVSSSKKR